MTGDMIDNTTARNRASRDTNARDRAEQETANRSATHRSRVRFSDLVVSGSYGLQARRGRALLTSVGVAIGIASMIAVLGISSSSRADLLAQIDELGTNLLRVQASTDMFGVDAKLPDDASAMIRRIGPVNNATATTKLQATVRKNSWTRIEGSIAVIAAEPTLVDTLEASVGVGRFLQDETEHLPTVVLGKVAADRLGIAHLDGAPVIEIDERPFSVVGILNTMPLAPDLDRSVFVSMRSGADVLGRNVVPDDIYVRTTPEHIEAVRGVLARTANPGSPRDVAVSRPSDALESRARVDQNLQTMLLGLTAVALLVSGVGIANVMVMSILERRSEIGLRRALGATRRHIVIQFLLEAMLLAVLGGLLGIAIGSVVTVAYARAQSWMISIPAGGLGLGVAASLALGALAGLYPAIRAARLQPAEAVRPGG